MKWLYRISIIIMVVALFASCKTTEKFLVLGTPNTKIYTPDYKHVGTIEQNGTANIELTSDYYYAFLLSKDAESDTYVPFALDYKYKSRAGAMFLKWTGIYIMTLGAVYELIGACLSGEPDMEDIAMPMVAGGLTGVLAGAAMGWPASERMDQTSYEYQFKYLDNQNANSDLSFSKAVFNEPWKETAQANSANDGFASATSVSKKQLTEKSAKSLKNYARQIANDYIGSGKLTQNSSTIESYSDIKVRVEYVSRNEVRVNVTESNGSDFFADYSLYKVEKRGDDSYQLTHSNIKEATITIDGYGNLNYNHPKVNIDGEIYNLQISASK